MPTATRGDHRAHGTGPRGGCARSRRERPRRGRPEGRRRATRSRRQGSRGATDAARWPTGGRRRAGTSGGATATSGGSSAGSCRLGRSWPRAATGSMPGDPRGRRDGTGRDPVAGRAAPGASGSVVPDAIDIQRPSHGGAGGVRAMRRACGRSSGAARPRRRRASTDAGDGDYETARRRDAVGGFAARMEGLHRVPVPPRWRYGAIAGPSSGGGASHDSRDPADSGPSSCPEVRMSAPACRGGGWRPEGMAVGTVSYGDDPAREAWRKDRRRRAGSLTQRVASGARRSRGVWERRPKRPAAPTSAGPRLRAPAGTSFQHGRLPTDEFRARAGPRTPRDHRRARGKARGRNPPGAVSTRRGGRPPGPSSPRPVIAPARPGEAGVGPGFDRPGPPTVCHARIAAGRLAQRPGRRRVDRPPGAFLLRRPTAHRIGHRGRDRGGSAFRRG